MEDSFRSGIRVSSWSLFNDLNVIGLCVQLAASHFLANFQRWPSLRM